MKIQKPIRIIDNRNKEKFQVDDAYLNGYANKCGWNATLVYLCLCRHANHVTQESFPSVEMMAEKVGVAYNTIRRGIQKLLKWNLIEVTREKDEKGQWLRNTYILLDKSVWKQDHSSVGAMETHSPVASKVHSPVVITNDTHTDNDTHILDVAFEEVWNSYPRKLGKTKALQAWKRSVKVLGDAALVRRALEVYKAQIARDRTEEKYIKHGSSWFNNWRDYLEMAKPEEKAPETPESKLMRRVCTICRGGRIEPCEDQMRCNQCNADYTDQMAKVELRVA